MAFIERDPQEMLVFAKSAEKYVSDMTLLVRTLRMTFSVYESELDDNCRNCIEKLNADCDKFLTQVEVYRTLAAQIKKKANKQNDIQPRF